MSIVMFYSQGTYLNTSSKYKTNWSLISKTIYGFYYFYMIPVTNVVVTMESIPIEYETLGVFCYMSFSFVSNICITI